MNYLDTLKTEAAKTVKPLADQVTTLTRQLASIRKRADDEKGSAAQTEANIANLKALAGEALTGKGVGAFDRYKTSLKKLTARLATSREIIETFNREILPAKECEIATAKAVLQEGLIALVMTHLPEAEKEMAALIGVVLRERDQFMASADAVFLEYGGDFANSRRVYPDGLSLRPDPYRPHLQIATGLSEESYDPADGMRRRGAYLTPAPQSAPSVNPVVKTPVTAQVGVPQARREAC
jgi:hypothetical protein